MPKTDSREQTGKSYFAGLRLKLALAFIVGSAILFLYYWKLFHFSSEQFQKSIFFFVLAIPYFLWPIPFNRRMLEPVIRYLKGRGTSFPW